MQRLQVEWAWLSGAQRQTFGPGPTTAWSIMGQRASAYRNAVGPLTAMNLLQFSSCLLLFSQVGKPNTDVAFNSTSLRWSACFLYAQHVILPYMFEKKSVSQVRIWCMNPWQNFMPCIINQVLEDYYAELNFLSIKMTHLLCLGCPPCRQRISSNDKRW